MVKNGFFLFCLSAFDLGLFGEQLLAARQDGNSRGSNISERKQFFHDPLRLYLARLNSYAMQDG
jgi:hypothetical protein